MADPAYYPDIACHLAPLRAEVIPGGCSCVICQRREAALHGVEPTPMVCPVCAGPESYYGRLVFAGGEEPATCPNHRASVLLVPVS